jgi:hypothetical protein
MALADRINFSDVYFSIPRLTKDVNQLDDMPEVLVKRGVTKRDKSLQNYALNSTATTIHYDAKPMSISTTAVNYDATLTNTIECVDQTMVVIGRKFSFSSCAMADYLTQNDHEGRIAKYLNKYWQRVRSRNIVKSLLGATASSLLTDTISNIATSGTIADANRLTKTNLASIIKDHFSDNFQALVMIMHSTQYAHLIKLGCVDFLYDELYGRIMPKVLGMDVLIDNACTAGANSTFYSFILGNNALVCAEAKETIPFAIVSDTGTREYLVTKKRYIAQPLGVSFTGTPAGTSPTEAELATSGNWTYNFSSATLCPIIKIIANADFS